MSSLVAVDPGFLPTMRQLALAVADELDAYVTPYWLGRPIRPLARLPLVGRELARRRLPPELAAVARARYTCTELARVSLQRMGAHSAFYPLLWRRNEGVDRAAARILPADATVLGENGGCRMVFERARRTGGLTVLDQPIARFAFGHELLREEAALRPDFAETIQPYTLKPRHFARLEREIDLADMIVVGSRFAAESFRGRVDRETVRVIPYGVDAAAFSPRRGPRRPGPLRVLFVGHLTQRKGIAYLLEAMRLLDPTRFELTLAGGTWGRRTSFAPYEGEFRHLTGLRPVDMPPVYRNADVLVLPSVLEGSAIAVLEAMASGLPVIVTPNVGADAVRDGLDGFVVPIRDPEAVAERLQALDATPDRREAMGRSGRARALEFTWERFRREFRSEFDRLRDASACEPAEGALVA